MLSFVQKATAWDHSEAEMTPEQHEYVRNQLEQEVYEEQQHRVEEWRIHKLTPQPKTAKSKDELHISLGIPKAISIEIHNWAEEQDWPEGTELEPIEEYHITMLYAPEGHDHKDDPWMDHESHAVSIKGIKSFPSKEKGEGKDAIVLTVDSETAHLHHKELAANAESAGVEISPFSYDDFKPHITIAYGSLPEGLKPPKLTFETEVSAVSPPREEKEDKESSWWIVKAHAPYEAELLKFSGMWGEDRDGEAPYSYAGEPYYHMAPTEERARIMQHGLIAAKPGLNPRYKTLRDPQYQFNTQPQGVYVTNKIRGTRIGIDTPKDIWEVNPTYIQNMLPDPHSELGNWKVIPHDLPPEALRLHDSADEDLWRMHGVDPLDPVPRWNEADEKRYVKQILPLPREWQIGQPTTAKLADSWTPKDSWPNALRERNGEPVDADCTCKDGHKLDCPCHGLHPTLPTYDDSLEFPDPSSPVGYDYHTDAPRTWMRAETKVAADQFDTREYPDALMMPSTTMQEPAQGNPHPEKEGCTCDQGHKLDCPVHGLNPTEENNDHTWSIPEGHPVGYPQDQPNSYQVNTGAYQQNDHEYSVECDCPNCLQRREHSWHIQSPGTSSESWGGLPRAEGHKESHELAYNGSGYGKGIVTPEGDIHTWNTVPRYDDDEQAEGYEPDVEDGAPTHADYWQELPDLAGFDHSFEIYNERAQPWHPALADVGLVPDREPKAWNFQSAVEDDEGEHGDDLEVEDGLIQI